MSIEMKLAHDLKLEDQDLVINIRNGKFGFDMITMLNNKGLITDKQYRLGSDLLHRLIEAYNYGC